MTPHIALVTGGNRGIGLEISRQLSAQGLRVILTSRDARKGQAAAERIGTDFLALDVSSPQSVHAVYEQVVRQYGRLDVLVNNAGVYLDEGVSLLEIAPEMFEETFAVNTFGAFYMSQAFIPLMRRHNYGRVVNVSSGYGQWSSTASSDTGAYKLSKLALNGMTRMMAAELARTNIKVNVFDPGWVRTDMGGSNAPRTVEQGADTAVWLATLPDNGPTGGFFYERKPAAW